MLLPGSLSASAWSRSGPRRLAGLLSESGGRTLYLLDVRTPGEFVAAPLPRLTRQAPGRPASCQATDQYVATLGARVVLIDGRETVRASRLPRQWLIQLGLSEVYVYGADAADLGSPARNPGGAGGLDEAEPVSAAEVAQALRGDARLTVIDLAGPPLYFEERRYIPGSVYAPAVHPALIPVSWPGPWAGRADLFRRSPGPPYGGRDRVSTWLARHRVGLRTDAWIAAGHPYETGVDRLALTPDVTLPGRIQCKHEATCAPSTSGGETRSLTS